MRRTSLALSPELVSLRLVGGRGAPLPADVVGKLAAKSASLNPRERDLAALGQALVATHATAYDAAVTATSKIASPDLVSCARAVTLQALANQLHVESSLSKVSGATTNVPKVRSDLQTATNAAVRDAANPSLEAALISAELTLDAEQGSGADALQLLSTAEQEAKAIAVSLTSASFNASAQFLTLALARSAARGATGSAAKVLSKAADDAAFDASLKAAVKNAGISTTTLSAAETEALAIVSVLASGHVAGGDLVPLSFDVFAPWGSSSATRALAAAAEVSGLHVEDLHGHELSVAQIRSALSQSKGSILDVAATGAADAVSTATSLLEQVKDRIAFNRAVALVRNGNLEAALSLFAEIERRDQYLDMWRVYLAKGQSLRTAGRLVDSDAAFGKLHALKRRRGADIPLMDEFRYKNAF